MSENNNIGQETAEISSEETKDPEVNTENKENTEKKPKKPSVYEIFRRCMLVICAGVLLYFLIDLGVIIYGYIEARHSTSDILGGAAEITKPIGDEATNNDVPITITPIVPETPSNNESKDPESDTEPGETTPPPVYSEYFTQWLAEINKNKEKYPDFVGFINIEGLGIRYPIVQSDDNEYYLEHLIDGSKNKRGEIFVDYKNDTDNWLHNWNIVLYGHNLTDGTKFNRLTDYKKPENFYNCPIEIITEDGIYTFDVFSFYKTDEENPYIQTHFKSPASFKEFCEMEQSVSHHESNFEFTGHEIIITLSTCVSYFGNRWCVHGVLTSITQ